MGLCLACNWLAEIFKQFTRSRGRDELCKHAWKIFKMYLQTLLPPIIWFILTIFLWLKDRVVRLPTPHMFLTLPLTLSSDVPHTHLTCSSHCFTCSSQWPHMLVVMCTYGPPPKIHTWVSKDFNLWQDRLAQLAFGLHLACRVFLTNFTGKGGGVI